MILPCDFDDRLLPYRVQPLGGWRGLEIYEWRDDGGQGGAGMAECYRRDTSSLGYSTCLDLSSQDGFQGDINDGFTLS